MTKAKTKTKTKTMTKKKAVPDIEISLPLCWPGAHQTSHSRAFAAAVAVVDHRQVPIKRHVNLNSSTICQCLPYYRPNPFVKHILIIRLPLPDDKTDGDNYDNDRDDDHNMMWCCWWYSTAWRERQAASCESPPPSPCRGSCCRPTARRGWWRCGTDRRAWCGTEPVSRICVFVFVFMYLHA